MVDLRVLVGRVRDPGHAITVAGRRSFVHWDFRVRTWLDFRDRLIALGCPTRPNQAAGGSGNQAEHERHFESANHAFHECRTRAPRSTLRAFVALARKQSAIVARAFRDDSGKIAWNAALACVSELSTLVASVW
jgi:hypothetical protein